MVEDDRVYIIESLNGRRIARAAAKILVDLVAEQRISEEVALLRIQPRVIQSFLSRTVEPALCKLCSI